MMKYFNLLFLAIFVISCSKDKPYKNFEKELTEQICECTAISKTRHSDKTFLKYYKKCTEKTSKLLQSGLNKYPEDTRISKKDYLEELPTLIKDITLKCM